MTTVFGPLLGVILMTSPQAAAAADRFDGQHYRGAGDVEYLQLLDIARRMFEPDPEFQNMPMLYMPNWNGLVEGPTWGAWWIQNSYGTSYCELPFLQEPFVTFLQNSQDLWFDQMGDGKRAGANDWVAPDGCLCDAASPGWIYYRQGDGRIDIHDWGMEFTAAGVVLQSELLLISRDPKAIEHYLPKLERSADFIESRRDPEKDLFLAGPAGNLLAPSYAGWARPDGTYDKAYLTGLSVTYIAGLNRLVELEKLAGRSEQVALYTQRRDLAKKGLALVTTEEGYLIRSLDPDGVKHGVFGAERHGYFEAPPNHDAICFRVVDDAQAERIYQKIASIPGLRPYDFIIPNYPSYDDMYEQPQGLWGFGTWVNGGNWSTCEARMMMAYYRLGKYEDARKSMEQLLTFARRFRMDNPLVKFGSDVYQPNEPINLTYDAFGPPAAFVRGLFEYLYDASGLRLVPHMPPTITELEQLDPIRFGEKKLYLSTVGAGPITGVTVNGKPWKSFDPKSVFLAYDAMPTEARIAIMFGGAKAAKPAPAASAAALPPEPGDVPDDIAALDARAEHLRKLHERLVAEGLGDGYEMAHVKLALDTIAIVHARRALVAAKAVPLLPEASQTAADQSYVATAGKLCDGLARAIVGYRGSDDPTRQRIYKLWLECGEAPGWYNIRSEGATQAFLRHGDVWRMSISGKPEASCGWAYDLPEQIVLPEDAQLVIGISGSEGARYFVDLMGPNAAVVAQTLWQVTPPEPSERTFELPAGVTVTQVILYTMTKGEKACNDWGRVAIGAKGHEPTVSVLTGTPRDKAEGR